MKKTKKDSEVWERTFSDEDDIKPFITEPGKKLTESKLKPKKGFYKFQPRDPETIELNTLKKRVEELEKDLKKIKKYLNSESKKSKRQRQNNFSEQPAKAKQPEEQLPNEIKTK